MSQLPPEAQLIGKRVRIVRVPGREAVRFQDPDRGNVFINNREALKRLTYSEERAVLVDSFGSTAGVGAIALPGRGVELVGARRTVTYERLSEDPRTYKPVSNEEIIERVVTVDRDGRLTSNELSYGRGETYQPAKYGAKWVTWTKKALKQPPEKKIPTRDLKRAVIHKEFILRKTE